MGEIHAASVARGMEKFSKVQNMLDFLSDNDCPSVLRHKIVQARHTHRKYLTLEPATESGTNGATELLAVPSTD